MTADNILKAITEVHIFLTLITALLIKSDQLDEAQIKLYDWALFVLFVLFVPVTFVTTVAWKLTKMRRALTETHSRYMKHPKPWRQYNKYTLAVSNDQENHDLLEWTKQMHTQHRREREIKAWDTKIEGPLTLAYLEHDLDDEDELDGEAPLTPRNATITPTKAAAPRAFSAAKSTDAIDDQMVAHDAALALYGKFSGYEYLVGNMEDFYGGLEKLIGDCRKDVAKTMDEEHCCVEECQNCTKKRPVHLFRCIQL